MAWCEANGVHFVFGMAMAYVLLCALRRIGQDQTHFANATYGIIRLKLLKIGAWCSSASAGLKSGWHLPVPQLISGDRLPVASPPGKSRRRLAIKFDHARGFVLDATAACRRDHPQEHGFLPVPSRDSARRQQA